MSKKRKKKEHHEEHVDESWLVPYADLLTLLLALFIVLYAMSSVDQKKFAALAEVFNQEFQAGTGIFEYPSPTPVEVEEKSDLDENNKTEGDAAEEKTSANKEVSEEELTEAQQKQDQEELQGIQDKVNSYIEKNNLEDKLETSLTDEGLLVSIRDNVLFASGSANIRGKDEHLVSEISKLLVMEPPRSIIVSGHTDDVPIKNSEFDSNWDLSVSRAINFMKLLMDNNKLNPSSFSAKGYGEFKPIASNKTEEGREKNRRVEILIQPRTVSED
ncbi:MULTISPECIES: flagellar motor protein MotB [unclassified Niallia]|uniref:flagellar motor protein MotB n=1 Tax=unclassified Niallia TaxID=2837522 RepID=UPI001EDA9D3C|nr:MULTISPECIES: flagellar motor protein MotB [unclassified Niallia]MDL0435581.1 flagellar motor protein MotB [Niallia sp. SS-2023]UPO88112.1 flagellar motor protein MotB [Niallia sp. Man26]